MHLSFTGNRVASVSGGVVKESIMSSVQYRFIAVGLCVVVLGCVGAWGESRVGDGDFTIGDKTLVAWVALANLSQQGGAVISLMDDKEHFDAIVFGERAAGKWMAGSDFFRRTPADQGDYVAERADETTLVQVAIVYKGNVITLYRNGERYARYEVEKGQSFDEYVRVLLGLRYMGGGVEVGFLAGAIEEARLYDKALEAEAIGELTLGVVGEGKPLGQWTFEDGTAKDAVGTFPEGALRGKAFIAEGRLELDGAGSYVEIGRQRPLVVQSLFYKARLWQTGNMWDTWLYLHEGTYYLYYLANRGKRWDNISLATSNDGVHWTERGPVLVKGEGVKWMGTGSTWKSPKFEKDGKFFMNFSEWRGPRQTIFFAESKDLLHWKRLEDKYEYKQDTRWYEENGRWDCIWTIERAGGGLYGYWTATPKAETGGRFGFGQTLDGVTWEALEPPKVQGVGSGEVGAVERIGERYYMMFGTTLGGRRGMMTLVAERPTGPFVAARKNLRLLEGKHTYFSRFLRTGDEVLVNHHAIARNAQVSMGLLKAAVVDEEGTLRLGWWQGNEKLKEGAERVRLSRPISREGSRVRMLAERLDMERGVVLEGRLTLPTAGSDEVVGLYVGCSETAGSGVLVYAGGRSELGRMQADGTGFEAERKVDREVAFGAKPTWRLLVKGVLLEFYVDDVLVACYSLPSDATGRIGVIGEVDELKAWRIAAGAVVER